VSAGLRGIDNAWLSWYEVFREIGGLAHVYCSKYQATDPKDVFATCRKYYTVGTMDRYCMVFSTLMHLMDADFQLML
jgi:hypothetical protein